MAESNIILNERKEEEENIEDLIGQQEEENELEEIEPWESYSQAGDWNAGYYLRGGAERIIPVTEMESVEEYVARTSLPTGNMLEEFFNRFEQEQEPYDIDCKIDWIFQQFAYIKLHETDRNRMNEPTIGIRDDCGIAILERYRGQSVRDLLYTFEKIITPATRTATVSSSREDMIIRLGRIRAFVDQQNFVGHIGNNNARNGSVRLRNCSVAGGIRSQGNQQPQERTQQQPPKPGDHPCYQEHHIVQQPPQESRYPRDPRPGLRDQPPLSLLYGTNEAANVQPSPREGLHPIGQPETSQGTSQQRHLLARNDQPLPHIEQEHPSDEQQIFASQPEASVMRGEDRPKPTTPRLEPSQLPRLQRPQEPGATLRSNVNEAPKREWSIHDSVRQNLSHWIANRQQCRPDHFVPQIVERFIEDPPAPYVIMNSNIRHEPAAYGRPGPSVPFQTHRANNIDYRAILPEPIQERNVMTYDVYYGYLTRPAPSGQILYDPIAILYCPINLDGDGERPAFVHFTRYNEVNFTNMPLLRIENHRPVSTYDLTWRPYTDRHRYMGLPLYSSNTNAYFTSCIFSLNSIDEFQLLLIASHLIANPSRNDGANEEKTTE